MALRRFLVLAVSALTMAFLAACDPMPVAQKPDRPPAKATSIPAASADASAPASPSVGGQSPPSGSVAASYTFFPYAGLPVGDAHQGVADLGEKLLAFDTSSLSEVVGGEVVEQKALVAGLPVQDSYFRIVGIHGSWPDKAFLIGNFGQGDLPTHVVYQWNKSSWKRLLGPKTGEGLGDSPELYATYTVFGPWSNGTLLAAKGQYLRAVTLAGKAPVPDLAGLTLPSGLPASPCQNLMAFAALATGHAFASSTRCDAEGANPRAVVMAWAPGSPKPTRELPLPAEKSVGAVEVATMAAASERAVFAGGSLDEKGYLAAFDGSAWARINLPGTKAVARVSVASGTVWLVADGAVFVGRPHRDETGALREVSSLTPGSGDPGAFARVALPKGYETAGFVDIIARSSGEVLLVGGSGLVSTRRPTRGLFAPQP